MKGWRVMDDKMLLEFVNNLLTQTELNKVRWYTGPTKEFPYENNQFVWWTNIYNGTIFLQRNFDGFNKPTINMFIKPNISSIYDIRDYHICCEEEFQKRLYKLYKTLCYTCPKLETFIKSFLQGAEEMPDLFIDKKEGDKGK